jgi:hypothetical protein
MAEGLMMNNDKTGGAAFPLESDYGSQKGMTLRDYFAGQALMGIMGNPAIDESEKWDIPTICNATYRIADYMIAEREKGGE